jgi:hypothetical protein
MMQEAKIRVSKHTPISPVHVPITLSPSLRSSRRSVKPKLNNLVMAKRPIISLLKERSLSSSRNHSTIPHVQTQRAVTRRSMIMEMDGCVRNVIEHGQHLSTGMFSSMNTILIQADQQVHSPSQSHGSLWADVDNGLQRGRRANDGYLCQRPTRP